jgi:preprotein translocase subunit SecA
MEAYRCFEQMIAQMRQDICFNLFRSSTRYENIDALVASVRKHLNIDTQEVTDDGSRQLATSDAEIELPKPMKIDAAKFCRNDLCRCGSGKKYKKCCGQEEE